MIWFEPFGSTKISGIFLNMLRMAYEVGEGMDSPSTNFQEHFAPPLAPAGANTGMIE
jgi:hypothetical protein